VLKRHELISVGISSCLLGERVRYDGGHKKNSYIIDTLGQFFEFRAFCPEMAIGLGVPRPKIHLIKEAGKIEVVGVDNKLLQVTDDLIAIAQDQAHWHSEIFGYIVKSGSPSCGMERVKIYSNDIPEHQGVGLYTKTMMENFPNLPVEEEGRLGEPLLRENFIQRVFIYRRWHELLEVGLSWQALMEFHAGHKLSLFSHNQDMSRKLGEALLNAQQQPVEKFANDYITGLMDILKINANRTAKS
jgi:uncharacterized protein YbbK (DUF523 family)